MAKSKSNNAAADILAMFQTGAEKVPVKVPPVETPDYNGVTWLPTPRLNPSEATENIAIGVDTERQLIVTVAKLNNAPTGGESDRWHTVGSLKLTLPPGVTGNTKAVKLNVWSGAMNPNAPKRHRKGRNDD